MTDIGTPRLSDEEKILSSWYADIPAPADATWVGPWYDRNEPTHPAGHTPVRYFHCGPHIEIGELSLQPMGRQLPDATTARFVSVSSGFAELTSEQARELAAALSNAADAIDAAPNTKEGTSA